MVDYFSFEDVMRELDLSEEDLKRMVSEGELRAFRDENKMKFKKEDVEGLRKGRITEPTIILPTTPGGEGAEETVLDLDIGEETSALADTAGEEKEAGELQFDETDLSLSETGPTVVESDIGIDTDETFIEEEIDTGTVTEPLALADETVEAAVVSEAQAAPAGRKTGGLRRVTARMPVGSEEELERQRPNPLWTVLNVAAFVLTGFFGLFFYYDIARSESGKGDRPMGITAGIAHFILDSYHGDANYKSFEQKELLSPPPFNADIENYGFRLPTEWYGKASFELPDTLPKKP